MPNRIWIIEDNYLRRQELHRQYAAWDTRDCVTVAEIEASIGDLRDDDCVTIDSQLPGDDDTPIDPVAGKKLITEIRMTGKRCRLFWHSPVPLDRDFKVDLAVQNASATDLSHLSSEALTIPDDVEARASVHRSRLSFRAIEYFNSLVIALRTFLFASSLDGIRQRPPANGLILDEIPPDVALNLFTEFSDEWTSLQRKKGDAQWWFRRPVLDAVTAWPAGTDGLAWLQREFYFAPAVQDIFSRGPLATDRWIYFSPLSDGSTGEGDGTAVCIYQCALRQLWHFCDLVLTHINSGAVLFIDVEQADLTYRALQLIGLIHYPFARSRALASRSVLSHQHLVNRMRILFQKPGVTEVDGGSPARTQAILRNEAAADLYPEISEALQQWPATKAEIESNIRSIAAGVDPFTEFIEHLHETFGWQWNAAFELHRECVGRWLGTGMWGPLALEALRHFDGGFELVRGGQMAIDGLIERFEAFQGLYSGRDFFNFQQTT